MDLHSNCEGKRADSVKEADPICWTQQILSHIAMDQAFVRQCEYIDEKSVIISNLMGD